MNPCNGSYISDYHMGSGGSDNTIVIVIFIMFRYACLHPLSNGDKVQANNKLLIILNNVQPK